MVEAGGTVTGNKGISAETRGAAGPGGSGNVLVISTGTITAKAGRGIEAKVSSGTGTLSVEATGGTINATGGSGIHAFSGEDAGNTDIMVSAGSSVSGDAHGIHTKHPGSATVTVDVAGTVTGGNEANEAAIKIEAVDIEATIRAGGSITGARGILADTKVADDSGDITVTSAGDVTATLGRGIETIATTGTGILSVTTTGGTVSASDTGIYATSGDDAGATDITVGAGSSVTGNLHGVYGKHTGSARVTVDVAGTVTGGSEANEAAIKIEAVDIEATIQAGGSITGARGVLADTKVADGSGDITITSGGDVTATLGRGIEAAATTGTGTLGVTTTGGTVTASDTGIYTTSGDEAGATDITVGAGSSVSGEILGIHAKHTGTAAVTVSVAGMVTGGTDASQGAIKIEAAGPASVTLTDEFRIAGDILFDGNDENDMLTLVVGEELRGEVMGKISMVDSFVKDGAGTAWLGDDVSFSGSSAMIRDGLLILRGHLDLGMDGRLTVQEGARLAVEIGGTEGDHGQVSAGAVSLARDSRGAGEFYVVFVEGEEDAAQQRFDTGITIFMRAVPSNADAKLLDGTVVASVKSDGSIKQGETVSRSAGSSGSGGGGAGILVLGGGALAYLLWDLGLFDEEAPLGNAGGKGQFGSLVRSFSSAPSGIRTRDRGIEYRVRLLESDTPGDSAILPASGVATSLRAYLGDGFHADLTGAPKLATGFGRDSVSGSRYGLGLGWRSGMFSTDIGYSHAALRARSTFTNLEGLGELSGQHDLRHDRVQANARLRLAGAGLSLSPSLSLFEGAVAQEGYTASSRVWLSDIPSISQDYKGWKAGLSLAPHSPLEAMGLHWRPELRLMTTQLASGGASLTVIKQRDRTGALRLDTPAQAPLPRTVHALGGGLTVAGGEDWALRGGYAALLANGALEHAAGAQLRMRF